MLICLLHFAKVQRVDPRQVDESVVRALRKYFPTEAKVLSDPRRAAGRRKSPVDTVSYKRIPRWKRCGKVYSEL